METKVIEFQRSTSCESSGCVEVAEVSGVIVVRASSAPEKTVTFTLKEWRAFIEGAKNCEFDY
jgi:hypothetical protein